MAEPRVRFDHVSKRFRRGGGHDSLRDLIPAVLRGLTRRKVPSTELRPREFWAVRDLSFEVAPGEVLGIIGHNGAGKSTVLKLLNRILEPTLGEAAVVGRVGALIEVSAGFHPDLTGRQNVYLQGAIMGMRKADVERKFDSIVDFSGISGFIDTPVKRYSSGMNARLGFSIAVHLEPEVLLIDEVLSVGDLEFQRRAYGAVQKLAQSGVPVVIVSHQLDRVVELCTSAILLERGVAKCQGTPAQCVVAHVSGALQSSRANGDDSAPIAATEIASLNGQTFASGERIHLRLLGRVNASMEQHDVTFGLRLVNMQSGQQLYTINSNGRVAMPDRGEFEHDASLELNVAPGSYGIEFFAWDRRHQCVLATPVALAVEVAPSDLFWGPTQCKATWAAAARPLDASSRLA